MYTVSDNLAVFFSKSLFNWCALSFTSTSISSFHKYGLSRIRVMKISKLLLVECFYQFRYFVASLAMLFYLCMRWQCLQWMDGIIGTQSSEHLHLPNLGGSHHIGNSFSQMHPATPENFVQTPFPQFPVGFQSGFFNENFGSQPPLVTHIPAKTYIPALPIQSVPPTTGTTIREWKTNPAKGNSKRPSEEDASNCIPTQPEKKPSTGNKTKEVSPLRKIVKKNPEVVYDEANVDFSQVPPPCCSCTGVARVCYKWGSGSWQSSCCNATVSQYPLPMSPSKPGARISGRKMSSGAYKKLLCKLASEGRDLSQRVDLKDHWSKLGTNKFVTIK